MKKIKLLLVTLFSIYAFSGVNMAYGFSVIKPVANSSSITSIKYLKVSEFVKLSAKEYSTLTGNRMNFFQRLSFNLTKVKLRHDLKKNPDLRLTDYMRSDGTFTIDILWLVLGFIFGLGVIFGYLTKQEKYKINSAWIGFGLFLLGILIFGHSIF